MGESLFSESWYRVSRQHVALRPGVDMQKQYFRGETWYVLSSRFNNQFYRIPPEAYAIVVRLDGRKTIETIWKEVLSHDPDNAPGQEEVIQLLSALYQANFIQADLPADSTRLFEKYTKQKKNELQSQIFNFLFLKFPLWDPDRFLQKTLPIIGRCMSSVGVLVWMVVIGLALKIVIDNFDLAREQSEGFLAPQNWLLLYISTVFLKTIHEFGHAYACRKNGGEVHTMGIMLVLMTPMPYVDASSSWAFQNKFKRAFVGAAGMICEFFVAGLATMVWINTQPGIVHSLSYNMMVAASISTLIFNINPLLKFDGYYIFSDLMELPNLQERAMGQVKYYFETIGLHLTDSWSPASTGREAAWLVTFGVSSGVYKVFVLTSILFLLANQFLGIGFFLALIFSVVWLGMPIYKLGKYIVTDPRLEKKRTRAVGLVYGTTGALLLFFGLVPWSNSITAPGLVETVDAGKLFSAVPGYYRATLTPSGTFVTNGQPLIQLENKELEMEIEGNQAVLKKVRAKQQVAMTGQYSSLAALRNQVDTVDRQLERLAEQKHNLTILAPRAGIWVSPRIDEMRGFYFERGMPVGEVLNQKSFRFSAVISQQQADYLYNQPLKGASVRIIGQAGLKLKVEKLVVVQGQQETLPSSSLGWMAGGPIEVSQDPSGTQAKEPF
ncbi:MAG: hypothetical protein SGI71_01170, partial [Verrucomicrobiota bacterium]|nr:hypothetical protein [Verrucomicrobiota bacterium]